MECLLLWDSDAQVYRLEKLEASATMRHIGRSSKSNPSIAPLTTQATPGQPKEPAVKKRKTVVLGAEALQDIQHQQQNGKSKRNKTVTSKKPAVQTEDILEGLFDDEVSDAEDQPAPAQQQNSSKTVALKTLPPTTTRTSAEVDVDDFEEEEEEEAEEDQVIDQFSEEESDTANSAVVAQKTTNGPVDMFGRPSKSFKFAVLCSFILFWLVSQQEFDSSEEDESD